MTLDELEKSTVETRFYGNVVQKLLSRGAKVIVGPRGVGKTHHMKIALKQAIYDKNKPLPIYVSFSKYLRLEPLKNNTSIALQYFHCWVLSKILLGLEETLRLINTPKANSFLEEIELDKIHLFCEQIEKQQTLDWQYDLLEKISVNKISNYIEIALDITKRKHAILLCDDAALVLTKEYMVEFFDTFRSLKSSKISPKASVYPNTEFGPRFHLGQDAESISCWPSVIDSEYEKLFEEIYQKRYSVDLKDDIKKCFMYAAFGIPRAFINLINQYNISNNHGQQSQINTVIADQSEIIIQEFLSLAVKQPQYKHYVQAGSEIFNRIITTMVQENKEALLNQRQQIFLGILKDYEEEGKKSKDLKIITRLLEETGLLAKVVEVKHGTTSTGKPRVYNRYIPHLTLLIKEGGYQITRGSLINKFAEYVSYPKEKHPCRKNSFSEFIDPTTLENLSLDLPPCGKCKNPRSDIAQKFCMYCGSELLNKSTFEELMSRRVDTLPLSNWLKNKIALETDIETIADIVFHSNPNQELRKVKGVGEKRATKVIEEATKDIEEFLY